MSGGGKGFGSQGQAGFLSPFDVGTANQAASFGTQAVTNRYQQLGLGGGGAMPSGPTSGAVPGMPGSGTTPTTGGSFAVQQGGRFAPGATMPNMPANQGFGSPAVANLGAGPTAMQMDIGALPSLTGGIPEEFQALLGQAQTADMSMTGGGGGGGGKGSKGGSGLGALGGLAKMGGK